MTQHENTSFWMLQRLERVIRAAIGMGGHGDIPVNSGIAVVLTNDPRLWDPERAKRKTNDVNFRVHEGRQLLADELAALIWLKGDVRYEGEAPVCLYGNYDMHWQDYSILTEEESGHFRYLAVSVGP